MTNTQQWTAKFQYIQKICKIKGILQKNNKDWMLELPEAKKKCCDSDSSCHFIPVWLFKVTTQF